MRQFLLLLLSASVDSGDLDQIFAGKLGPPRLGVFPVPTGVTVSVRCQKDDEADEGFVLSVAPADRQTGAWPWPHGDTLRTRLRRRHFVPPGAKHTARIDGAEVSSAVAIHSTRSYFHMRPCYLFSETCLRTRPQVEIHLAPEHHQWYIGAVDGVPGSTVHLYLDLHHSYRAKANCGATTATIHALGKHFSLVPMEPAEDGYAALTLDDNDRHGAGCGTGAPDDPGMSSPEFDPDQPGGGSGTFDELSTASRRRQRRQLGGPESADATACEVFLDADDRFFRAFRGAGGTVREQAQRVTARMLSIFAAAKTAFDARRGMVDRDADLIRLSGVLISPCAQSRLSRVWFAETATTRSNPNADNHRPLYGYVSYLYRSIALCE